jgi:hypothetical protein
MSEWSREQQQIAALAALCGILIGSLKAVGAFTQEHVEAVFSLADQVVPEAAETFGPEALALVRQAARAVQGQETDD